jgi:hypothetical protein
MPAADVLKKLRAYYHFIKRQQKHKEAFGVPPSGPCSSKQQTSRARGI